MLLQGRAATTTAFNPWNLFNPSNPFNPFSPFNPSPRGKHLSAQPPSSENQVAQQLTTCDGIPRSQMRDTRKKVGDKK